MPPSARGSSWRLPFAPLVLAAALGVAGYYLFASPNGAAPPQPSSPVGEASNERAAPAPVADPPRGSELPARDSTTADAEPQASLAPPASAPSPEYPDEASITRRLRELEQSSPDETLELARDGNERFPDGPDAAERNWYLTRALVNQRRFYEAREQAKLMVERFPNTHWAGDVERHLLTHPLGLPSREQQQRDWRESEERERASAE